MSAPALDVVVLGRWGNGHATAYCPLFRELAGRGHRVLVLERDRPRAARPDLTDASCARIERYRSLEELNDRFGSDLRWADLVILGSCVPDGVAIGRQVTAIADGVTAFYDIDPRVTLVGLAPALIPLYDLYLSVTGGPTLRRLETHYGSPMARPLYCSVDTRAYYVEEGTPLAYDLGYRGPVAPDRQPAITELLLRVAQSWPDGRFAVAGPRYPDVPGWPGNIEHIEHLPPTMRRRFYHQQRFTLHLTGAAETGAGHSPSVRLFEAAACGTPIITDLWPGLESLFAPGHEILPVRSGEEVLTLLRAVNEEQRRRLGERARARVLSEHTAAHRAEQLERYALQALASRRRRPSAGDWPAVSSGGARG